MDTIRYDLKTLNRQFQLASKQRIALQEQSFSGIRKLFDSPVRRDGTQKWVDFTHDFWHVDCVRSSIRNAFTERYRKWCKRNRYNFSMEKAAEVYALAKSAVVLVQKTPFTKTLVQEAAKQLTATSRSVEAYRTEMNKLAFQLPEYPVVMEMYGVGESPDPQLMAEIGDVRRFARKQSLVAFAGIDPMPNQSGEKNVRSNKSSKHGSPYLRKTLFNIMTVYRQKAPADESVYQFPDRKRAEGKPYYVYMTAGANKFLR
ncbi:MAG: transposase, partial [Oscillospiraceae bacterium]|nr:transposase [Oscillospiraceae bacterium]